MGDLGRSRLAKGYLQEFAVADGRLERSIEVQDGDRFHPGGIAADANSIWIPVAEYRAKKHGGRFQRRNKRTLALSPSLQLTIISGASPLRLNF